MKINISDFIINISKFFYEKIFHEEMSGEIKKFIKNLTYIGIGTIIAMIFSFTFNILAGRLLGPLRYGEFTLVQSVAMFLYIPMILGISTAMVKYSSEKKDEKRQAIIVSTAYIMILTFTITSVILLYVFSSQFSNLFSISKEIFYLSIAFAVLFALYTCTTDILRGLLKIKILSVLKPIFSIVALSAFLLFIIVYARSYISAVFSMYLAYGVTSIIAFIFILKKYFTYNIKKSWANKLLRYGIFTLLGSLSFVFYTNIDVILINRYMTELDVGIYRAYYFSSIYILGFLWNTFNVVFFPSISKYKNKEKIFNKIKKIIPYLIAIGIPFVFVCELVILKFYGKSYPLNFQLMILFAATSVLIVCYGLYDWTFCSQGIKGVKLVTMSSITIAIINIILNILLIPRYQLFGAILATTISFIIGIIILSILKRKV